MNITLLHYAAPPVVGGVEGVIGEHARLMAADGQQVTILAGRGAQTDPRIPFIGLPQVDSRHPEVLSVKTELDAGKVTQHYDQLVANLEGELTQRLADTQVLIAHNVCSLNKNLALTAALKKIAAKPGAPRLILWHHDLAWTTPRYRSELHDGYPWDLLRTDWPEATQVTVSEMRRYELAQLLGVPDQRIEVVPNGVDLARFLKLEDQTMQLVEKLDLLDADPLLLLPVRITPRKNIELAIRSLAALRGTFPSARLVVTGPLGPHNPANTTYFQQLTSLRASLKLDRAVVFLVEHTSDYLPDEVIADFYHLADALIFPSLEEGFGIPILEAGLAGLPVFCADIPPLRELGEGCAVFFSPKADPREVGRLISYTIMDDSTFKLRQRVKQEYTWQSIYKDNIRPLLTGKR
ncbi:MAG: glycosyltransferase [Anaerolineaceae bacterium]|jgi:glycosyltransferase involved in cell wall biosynthesis